MILLISAILIYLILIKIPIVGQFATIALIIGFLIFFGSVVIRAYEISNEREQQQQMEYRR